MFKSNDSSEFEKLIWDDFATNLMEIIIPVWKIGVVKTQKRELASKKALINAMERIFDVNLKNFDVMQWQMGNRKDCAPFLTKLHQTLSDFMNAKLE